jgi:hypothetical protein
MSTKFENVPVEDDTKIISQQETRVRDFDILHQKWFWDGITAESIIFSSEDIANLDDQQIEHTARLSPLLKPGTDITIERNAPGFIFVNFNFEYE